MALIAYWPFDEGTGLSAADATGNGHTITITNGDWEPSGKFGTALEVVATTSHAGTFTPITLSTDYTVAVWFNGWGGVTDGIIVGGSNGRYAFYIDATDLYHSAELGNFAAQPHGGGLSDGAWHHLVVTRAGATVIFYKDGVQIGLPQTLSNPTYSLILGAILAYDNGGFWLRAQVDDLRIYDTTFTAGDVTTLYNLTPGGITLTPPAISSGSAVTAPTITPGAVTLVLATLATAAALFLPVVAPGAVTLTPPTLATAAVVRVPSLAAVVTSPTLASASTLSTPTLAYTITTPTLGSTATLAPPSFVSETMVALPTRASTSALTAPTLGYAVTTPTLTGTVLRAPTLTMGTVTLTLPTLASGSTLYGADVGSLTFVAGSITVTGGTSYIGGTLSLLDDQPGGTITGVGERPGGSVVNLGSV